MDLITALGIIALSVLAGVVGSMLGLGGGVVIIPSLVLVFGLPMQQAVGASLVGVIATSTGAACHYVQEGLCNVRLGMVLETATALGSSAGAALAIYANEGVLALIFSLLLIYSAVYMLRGFVSGRYGGREWPSMSGDYRDGFSGERVTYIPRRLPMGMLASFFAGSMSGMLGIGGGSVKVPVMHGWMGIPMKAAAATSNFMIGVTALAGAVVYYSQGIISPVITALVAVGVFAGAVAGSRVTAGVRPGSVRVAFALVLLALAFLMILGSTGVMEAI
ncbi:MAG: sulfite exporter TauE/SafE family protein [Methanomassiliicoccales archaeon]